jgi:large subunit ribosomal protein L29
MKRTDLRALRELTLAELETRARETKEELFNLRFALRTGHLSDFSRVKLVRRTYAQIQTAISEKRIALRSTQDRHEARHGAA